MTELKTGESVLRRVGRTFSDVFTRLRGFNSKDPRIEISRLAIRLQNVDEPEAKRLLALRERIVLSKL